MSSNIYQLPFRVPVRTGSRSASRGRKKRRAEAVEKKKKGMSTNRPRSSSGRSKGSSSRKQVRKRSSSTTGERSGHEADTDTDDIEAIPEPWSQVPLEQAKSHMTSEMVEQYRTAGLDFNEPLPKGRFPHASYEERDPHHRRKNRLTKSGLQAELSQLGPLAVGASLDEQHAPQKPKQSLKYNAIAVMVAIMHRCLQQGDYRRACRAFGALLRTRVNGLRLDLRRDHFWGIGAEIIMKKDRPRRPYNGISAEVLKKSAKRTRRRSPSSGGGFMGNLEFEYEDPKDAEQALEERETYQRKLREFREESVKLPMPTPAAMEKVREYYNLLALQHPPSVRPRSDMPSAKDFYLAMYGIWISHVDSVRKLEERNIRRHYSREGAHDDDEKPIRSSNSPDASTDRYETTPVDGEDEAEMNRELQLVRERQLESVKEIHRDLSDKMGERLEYGENVELLEIRGSLELWLADLYRPWSAFMHSNRSAAEKEKTEPGKDDAVNPVTVGRSTSVEEHGAADLESLSSRSELAERYPYSYGMPYDENLKKREAHLAQAEACFNRAKEKQDEHERET